jgi:hypothetical protein
MDIQAMVVTEGIGRNVLEARLREAAAEIDALRTHVSCSERTAGAYLGAVAALSRDRVGLLDQVRDIQVRCTELLDESRANRRIARAPPGELVALAHISYERRLQDEKFGAPSALLKVPDGTGEDGGYHALAITRQAVATHETETGRATCCWAHVLREEFDEVLVEIDPKRIRAELVQLAAVCCRWIEVLDRREARASSMPVPDPSTPYPLVARLPESL